MRFQSGGISCQCGRAGPAEIGQRARRVSETARPSSRSPGDRPRARQRLNFPKRGALAVIFFVRLKRVDQQTLFAVGPQPRVGVKSQSLLRSRREQFHDFEGELWPGLARFFGFRIRDEDNVQVRTVINFRSAQFAEADDDERRRLDLVLAHHDFERVLQAGVRQRGKFDQILLEIGEAENVAQADAHQFGLMIAAQPQELVLVSEAVAQIAQCFLGSFCAGATGRWSRVHPPGPACEWRVRPGIPSDRTICKQQFENRRVAVPQFEQRRARAVGRDETVEPGHHAVGIGQRTASVARLPVCGGAADACACLRAQREQPRQQLDSASSLVRGETWT